MATDTAPDFDLGPLTWVQGEIDQALSRGLESLATFKASPSEVTALKQARAHVHQATGAIQMVGLDAVGAYTDEIERQLSRLEDLPPPEAQETCELIDRACRKLKIFLDELVNGVNPVPLKLFPEYELMQLARGAKAASPTDLFYPDLSPRAPKIGTQVVTKQNLPSYLIKQRRIFQRGLLAWLRGNDEGAKVMRDAIQAIEDVQTHSAQRSFWWTVGALLESIAEKGVESGFGVKQLCGRVDLQIRRFVEGSAKVADRMRREVLYYVAISSPVGPQVLAVQRTFRLAGLIPSAEVLSADVVRMQPLLRDARDLLVTAKDLWLKLTSGRMENMPKLKQTLGGLRDKASAIGEPSLTLLVSALAARLDKLPAGLVPEAMAMEYATGLLLAESATDNLTSLSPELPRQVEAMLARLDAAQQNKPVAAAAVPLLDEMARRAQERLLLAQVAREIQANLRHMEQVLDAFFRDHEKRADLGILAHDSKQIAGALKILGLEQAETLLALCQQQIDEYAKPETEVTNDDLELLAESLSGLGFYVEAVEQQRPDRERLIEPLLAKRLGVAPVPRPDKRDSVEVAVAELKAGLQTTLSAFKRAPGDAMMRERLLDELMSLRNDAELLDDAALQAAADAALAEASHASTGDTAALQDAIDAISGAREAEPVPAPSEETMRLLETDATQLDAELFEIYLTEADEVLDTVTANAARLTPHPDDREALTTIRRAFHTLKGSGRMVGLTDLGELAFAVEKIHNRLLEEDLPVTPAMLAMIGVAQTSFRVWVDTLRRKGRVRPDPKALYAAIANVAAELPAQAPPAPMSEALQQSAAATFAQSAAAKSEPTIEVIELDETPMPEPGGDTLDAVPVIESAEVIEFAPRAPPPDAEAQPPSALVVPLPEPEETTVGDVTLSTPLYRILCDEAQQHLSALDAELQSLQFDPHATPSQAMVRASHTLCGIHRTGGFALVATTAKALEQCLLGLQASGAPMPSAAQPVLARAIAGLAALAARIRTRQAFRPGDEAESAEIIAELDALRQEASVAPALEDSETVAVRLAEAEEQFAPGVTLVPVTPAAASRAETAPPAPAEIPPAKTPTATAPAVASGMPRIVRVPPSELAPAKAADDALADVRDDVDLQVLPIFLEEAAELFPRAGEQLRNWRRKPGDTDAAHGLRRTLHTFKGSARMAGAMRLGELTHQMEGRMLRGDALAKPTPELFEALDTDLDRLAFVLDRLQRGEVNTAWPWAEAEAMSAAEVPAPAPRATAAPIIVPVAAPTSVPAAAPAPLATPAPATTEGAPVEVLPESEAAQRAMLRVRADLIDRLVNEAGEVAIARARVEGELRSLKGNLLELTNSVIRLRSQVREIEIQAESQIQSRMSMVYETAEGFDPLEFDRFTRFQELTRHIAEGVNDVATVQLSLLKNIDDADAALLAQARMSRDVQQKLFSIRTVPFGSLSERLYRILRQTAKELDKRANLEIRGAQVELDRSVLEKLVGPLEHLLRNALDHGIESREARVAAGKPETGEISLNVRQQGNEIVIELSDDGGGLDFTRIRERAGAKGLIALDAEPTEARLIECIFTPGFSTAPKVTQISGLGVGMDVVRSEVAALGGRVDIATIAGKGTTLTFYLPLTLAIAQTVLVRAAGRLWALPAPMIAQVQQIKERDLINLYLQREVVWQERRYPFFYLPRLLGEVTHNPATLRYNSVILLKSGQHLAAIHVDEMIGTQEVVVKNIGPQLARVSGIAGATVLGTGEVVLIINAVQLAQRMGTEADVPMVVKTPQFAAAALAAAATAGPPLIMIVDDSLTIRKITSRLLTREGFEVVTAKDGLDALQLLSDNTPDAILLDIEMPRMDGFEFAKTARSDPKTAHIPIIVITSRTAEKHRNRAKELGIECYLGKPFQEEELLRSLREMLALHTA